MSQGAVFKLVLRDERFDKFFTASDYLRARLDAVRRQRAAAGERNVQPTFADIERSHILYIHAAYRPHVAVASEYARVKPSGDGSAWLGPAGATVQFTFPIYGHFTSDMALHVRFSAVGSAPAAAAGADPTAAAPLLRYCAYPGLRLLRRVELRSAEMPIDNYDTDDAVHYSKAFVDADHRVGWERCHGQQEARQAVYSGNGYTGSLVYHDGPQTPSLYQAPFDMFIPLQFWMCRDASHALLNDMIANTQRTITCELAPIDQIIQALIPSAQNPGTLVPTPLPFNKLRMDVSLYVNGLYVNPEIHDIFASRIGVSLIRVHRREVKQLQAPADAFLLDQLKFPAEYLLVGLRDRRNADDFDRWWLMGAAVPRTNANRLMVPVIIWNAALNIYQLVYREATPVSSLEPMTDSLGVTAHGVEIYPMAPAGFYNAYLPVRYAENSMVVSPVDSSVFLVTFCLYPGKFNPSGHYNLSAGRELYINYSLRPEFADIEPGRAEMVISMSALNFLIRKGDRINLRYAL